MRIYKMTATFGKLEHETLTLQPGLNVIEAPNEWGKTTWCAFLITMLYGLDTRAKTTKTALADKEKYAPWSGSPMAGRIDLHWNGRDITIERSTKGRTPMGVFRAYETESGLAVPELTAANCGQLLLGAEQSVFRRTGFIRQSDMPVTQDDALRRRLNALVTTGDETGDSDRLAAELKDLKNKVRYNRSGLLPQAELQRKELEDKLTELESLESHSRTLRERLGEVKSWLRELDNHRDALAFAAAEADAAQVAQARDLRDRAETAMTALEQQCARQPSREDVQRKITAIQNYQMDVAQCQAEEASRIRQPEAPVPPEVFRGMTMEQAETMVQEDMERYGFLKSIRYWLAFLAVAVSALILCLPAVLMQEYAFAAAFAAAGGVFLLLGLLKKNNGNREARTLEEKYGSDMPEAWQLRLAGYGEAVAQYEQAMIQYRSVQGDLDIKNTFLQKQRESLFGGQSPDKVLALWTAMARRWEEYETARREFRQAEKHLQILQDMAKQPAKPPAWEDTLTYSASQTQTLLAEAQAEQQRLQNRLGQYQGRMEALGSADSLGQQRNAVQQRIEKLEQTYDALTLALDTLAQARQELQRKFAPRIAQRAQELLGKMTKGRYDRLTLREDLSLLSGAGQEETLHETWWRSDGTMDQMYVALRLAVAEELMPEAPLVLDDAFVRFDDDRLKAAIAILQEEAEKKQVILFTCQSREKQLCDK